MVRNRIGSNDNVAIKQHDAKITQKRACPPAPNDNKRCWSMQSKKGNFSENVLGEPSDSGVGTLLVSNCSTTSSSYRVHHKGEVKRGVSVSFY